jgi:UDP:flavonoid glycosyltransferase YjiC (YdhE family)
MKTFYFNTGVLSHNKPLGLMKGQMWKGGTMQIPFDCKDVPENAIFKHASDESEKDLPDNWIRREMFNTTMVSKYAFFLIP